MQTSDEGMTCVVLCFMVCPDRRLEHSRVRRHALVLFHATTAAPISGPKPVRGRAVPTWSHAPAAGPRADAPVW